MFLDLWEKKPGEFWIKARLYSKGKPTNEWIPSFEDLHRILWAIGYCEKVKYQGKTPGGRSPLWMPRMAAKFAYDGAETHDAWNEEVTEAEWDRIAAELKIRIRETPEHWPPPDGSTLRRDPVDESRLARMSDKEKPRYLAQCADSRETFEALCREFAPGIFRAPPTTLDYFWTVEERAR